MLCPWFAFRFMLNSLALEEEGGMMRVEDLNQIDIDFLSGGESYQDYIRRRLELGHTSEDILAALQVLVPERRRYLELHATARPFSFDAWKRKLRQA